MLVQDRISFTPFKLYETAAKAMRIYTEWLLGDRAWNTQVNPLFLLLLSFLLILITELTWTWSNVPPLNFDNARRGSPAPTPLLILMTAPFLHLIGARFEGTSPSIPVCFSRLAVIYLFIQ